MTQGNRVRRGITMRHMIDRQAVARAAKRTKCVVNEMQLEE